ncbi:MAG: DinB family protein [Fimbriimonadaceae bacterium]
MPELNLLIAAWDEGLRELGEAFLRLPDGDVWRRANPKLLSIGELAGHIAYWDAVWISGWGLKPNPADLPIKSPLIDPAFRYYTTNVEEPKQLLLGADEVFGEVSRVHREAKEVVSRLNPDSADQAPGLEGGTWGDLLQYRAFHVAYHTGQIYSVRHLLGHETEDN